MREVVERSGHSTYRVLVSEGAPLDIWQRQLALLQEIGCSYERATERLFGIDVPSDVNIHDVYRLLADGEAGGAWSFEEGHCGHIVQ